MIFVALLAAAFAIFPLTDTDIWWHLACAREWVTTWTPVREPVVNVHEYFQQVVAFVYHLGGAPLLVAFKSLLWGSVFALFLWPVRHRFRVASVICVASLMFIFRYQLEMRPVVFTLLFLGVYWNILPWLFSSCGGRNRSTQNRWAMGSKIAAAVSVLLLQWLWCKCQGLYILGPIFAAGVLLAALLQRSPCGEQKSTRTVRILPLMFTLLLFCMPLMHGEGVLLAAYPFELLNRLLGLSHSGTIFANNVAENRSPLSLMMAGENLLSASMMVLVAVASLAWGTVSAVRQLRSRDVDVRRCVLNFSLVTTSLLTLSAERNFILLFPLFVAALGASSIFEIATRDIYKKKVVALLVMVFAFLLGLWIRSLNAYDASMVSFQRVPVAAAQWMNLHPHQGRLFNDDRAGGYLAFMNPSDSTYIDGRFILKSADFFKQYLHFADAPADFIRYADSAGIDRAIFPTRYYARWDKVIEALSKHQSWLVAYQDDFYVVFDLK